MRGPEHRAPAGDTSPGSLFLSGLSELSMHLCKHWTWGHTRTCKQLAESLDWRDICNPQTLFWVRLLTMFKSHVCSQGSFNGNALNNMTMISTQKNKARLKLHQSKCPSLHPNINSLQLFPERPMNSLVSAFHRYFFKSSIFWWSVLWGIGLRFHLSKFRSSCSRGWCSASSSCSSSNSWPCLRITLWGWWKEEEEAEGEKKNPSPHILNC